MNNSPSYGSRKMKLSDLNPGDKFKLCRTGQVFEVIGPGRSVRWVKVRDDESRVMEMNYQCRVLIHDSDRGDSDA